MEKQVVLDSSALLAVFYKEPGADNVELLLDRAVISSVNAAEVMAVLVRSGTPPSSAWAKIVTSVLEIANFDPLQARLSGELMPQTMQWGLSAGDRACLALALTRNVPVFTADRMWAFPHVGADVRLIR